MGIVVYCPNGHRVKVKDVFAGKRVHCPVCQAKTRVPRSAPAAVPPGSTTLPTAQLLSLPPEAVATLPRAQPLH
jgi:hypothetical protein